MAHTDRSYIPAAGHDWCLPLYDPIVKLLGGDRARQRLVDQAALRPGLRVLDIGCGTGTLAVFIKRRHPGVDVVGIDPDPKALARARRKAARAHTAVHLDRGFSGALPYPDASFDRVFSSFMFHHLGADEKARTLREVRRVLAPSGTLHLVDFIGQAGREGGERWLHSHGGMADNAEDRVLALLNQAGFSAPAAIDRGRMLFGHFTYRYYAATAPADVSS